jgi:Xaa-Pro aminopeptidase
LATYGLMGVDWEDRINFERLRRERLEKAHRALSESNVDMLFVFRTEDARYLTGYRHHLGPAFILGNAVVILPRDGEPTLFTMDFEFARTRMHWLPKDRILPRANFREPGAIRQWAHQVKHLYGELHGLTVGVDIYTPAVAQVLREEFPRTEFVDGYGVLLRAKIIKTEDEVECLKVANAMTEAAMDVAIRSLRPGIRENEVLAIAWYTMTALGSEWTQCANIVCSGPYTHPYRRFTSDRIIREGDLVIIDIGACFNGYYGDLTRTWLCGDLVPTPEQKRVYQACYTALFNACAQARPGNTTADVYRAAEPHVLDSLGHGSGVNPWEPPFFSAYSKEDPVPLRAGMQFNLEPYAGEPGVGGVRLENNLVVREHGPEIYTTYPFDERFLDEVHPLDVSTGRVRRPTFVEPRGKHSGLAGLTGCPHEHQR